MDAGTQCEGAQGPEEAWDLEAVFEPANRYADIMRVACLAAGGTIEYYSDGSMGLIPPLTPGVG
jgi:hypothetical protein